MFVLASRSLQRLQLLGQIGYVPDKVINPDIDETPYRGEIPPKLVERLAIAKLRLARDIVFSNESEYARESVVLAADTVVALGTRIVAAPCSPDDARAGLKMLSGRAHRVYSSVAVGTVGGIIRVRTVKTRVVIKQLDDQDLNLLIESGQWRSRAGGYAIQGAAASVVRSLNGSYSSVVGLPLCETANLLKGVGLLPTAPVPC